MLGLKQVHHIAIIATDYAMSKAFLLRYSWFHAAKRSLSRSARLVERGFGA
ncbi:glyoxylase I family protein [Escherichia coli]|uniref:Glyoxylase I family protein n=1 Tax=Escherichia coli TaxID=562 RepID=A0A377KBV6_ECOLX|nr:glyoxylase I family protein [Escherichia coli]